MKIHAHSLGDRDESLWELLSDHLARVGELAGEFARPFGGEEIARAEGLLHDIGKRAAAYQRYIRGLGSSPDHSTAGALEAFERYGPLFGRLMAFAIAGHHAGLADGTGDDGPARTRPGRTGGAGDLDEMIVAPRAGAWIDLLGAAGVAVVIPSKITEPTGASMTPALYGGSHLSENFFAKLKPFRAIATR